MVLKLIYALEPTSPTLVLCVCIYISVKAAKSTSHDEQYIMKYDRHYILLQDNRNIENSTFIQLILYSL